MSHLQKQQQQQMSLGGFPSLVQYHESLGSTLATVYPEYRWQVWRFDSMVPRYYWNNPQNRLHYFEWTAKQLHVRII